MDSFRSRCPPCAAWGRGSLARANDIRSLQSRRLRIVLGQIRLLFLDRRTIVRYRTCMADDGQYLASLQDYYVQHRVLPSYSRIGALVGLNSKASVAGMVLRLKSEGLLESSPDRRLK